MSCQPYPVLPPSGWGFLLTHIMNATDAPHPDAATSHVLLVPSSPPPKLRTDVTILAHNLAAVIRSRCNELRSIHASPDDDLLPPGDCYSCCAIDDTTCAEFVEFVESSKTLGAAALLDNECAGLLRRTGVLQPAGGTSAASLLPASRRSTVICMHGTSNPLINLN